MSLEKFDVLNRFTGKVQFTAEIATTPDMLPRVKLGLAIQWGIKNDANLSGANLSGANLSGANLRGANLSGANLSGANLIGANLSGAYLIDANLSGAYLIDANLSGANLIGANLSGANLRGANLSGANLRGANLSGAYLRGANLSGANLSGANLRGANLSGANLRGANLSGANLIDANLSGANLSGAYLIDANLSGAKDADYAIAQTRILPDGDLIGWKKCQNGVIVRLRIPEDAPRSHAFGRKCRAKFADVLEVIGADQGIASHDGKTIYRTGERVEAPNWLDDWQTECAGGIHFYITRLEAENH